MCFALGACASRPGVAVQVASEDYGFVDEILNGEDGTPRKVEGQLSFPAEGDVPFPAVVIMHSSLGRDAQVWMYVRRLNEMGFATLAIDSFTDRGITEIEYDQTVVSEASMVAIEETNNAPLTGDTMSEVLEACSSDGFMAGGNRRAARAAWFRTATELRPFTYRRVAQISE